MEHTITAVLFDWDLTLARVLGDVTESERLVTLFRTQGLDYTAGQMEAAIEKCWNGVSPDAATQLTRPQTRKDIINYYFRILTHLGYYDRDWALGNRLYSAHSTLPTYLYPDTLPVLRSLQQSGFSLGIITNHAQTVRKMIEQRVGEFIPSRHIIISQEVGVHKPTKSIFHHATRRVRVPAARCIFVGDNLAVDAIGAVEQGGFGRGLWLDRKGVGPGRPLPERVSRVTSLDQVLNFLSTA